jgi:alcohol dehydrogenase (cytochrome c)
MDQMKMSTRSVLAVSIAFIAVYASPTSFARAEQSDDWITINKDYSGQRYINLDEITPANVGELKERCEIQLNEPTYFNSGLLKVKRMLYVTTLRGTYAFDAVNCQLRWRYVIDFKQQPVGLSNRGPGYLDGKIFRGTVDGRVIALDANTGRLLWDVQAANPARLEAFISAPIAWEGKLFLGIGVSDSGIAGRLMAFDANTGQQLWEFQTTMGHPSGGGSWTTYSLDPDNGEVFASVANPYPDFNRDLVPGDNASTIYTDSVVSVDAASGRLNWHYQAVPRDEHDWDLAAAPMLYRTSVGRYMVAIAGKNGRVYGIDRSIQALAFNTPATTLENDQAPLSQNWMRVCPGVQGGSMFNGTAYNPTTNTLFVGMSDHCAWFIKNAKFLPHGGAPVKDWSAAAKLQAPKGWITAIDGTTGTILWQYRTESQVLAGLVPTKSGLLFGGDTHGNLLIFDATSGSLLKSIDVRGALNSGLISYQVDGEQYVAAAVGGATENPSTVAGPLRVVIYSLRGPDGPDVVTLERLEPSDALGTTAMAWLYFQNCLQCHGTPRQAAVTGSSAPPIGRQSQLADPTLLKQFLATRSRRRCRASTPVCWKRRR